MTRWASQGTESEAFTHLRTGVPCEDRVGLLNVLLIEGLNLGLGKMAVVSRRWWKFEGGVISG
jgi:hypothetical protein